MIATQMAGESEMHRRLKEQTFLWAYERGYRCCAMEVRAPRSRFIVDLAGIRFDRMDKEPTVAVFECKQSREDLERNNRRQSELKASLKILQERRETLERLLAIHYPSLRTTDSLSRNGQHLTSVRSITPPTGEQFKKSVTFSVNCSTTRSSTRWGAISWGISTTWLRHPDYSLRARHRSAGDYSRWTEQRRSAKNSRRRASHELRCWNG